MSRKAVEPKFRTVRSRLKLTPDTVTNGSFESTCADLRNGHCGLHHYFQDLIAQTYAFFCKILIFCHLPKGRRTLLYSVLLTRLKQVASNAESCRGRGVGQAGQLLRSLHTQWTASSETRLGRCTSSSVIKGRH